MTNIDLDFVVNEADKIWSREVLVFSIYLRLILEGCWHNSFAVSVLHDIKAAQVVWSHVA